MIRTITNKLLATVKEVIDVAELFPAPALKGRIALDVHIEQGSIAVGKKVRLCGPDSEQEVSIVGIEMVENRDDPNTVRILCSKPAGLAVAAGKVDGWSIAEH